MGMIFLDILEFCEPRDVAVNDMIGGEPCVAQSTTKCQNPIPISSKFTVLLNFYLASNYWFNSVINKNIMWNGPEMPLQLRPTDSTSCKR